jgi:hypothetical protein
VYDVVTLIAEVSGFADLFVLSFSSLFGLFFSPKAVETGILNHMQFTVNKKKQKKPQFTVDQPIKLD